MKEVWRPTRRQVLIAGGLASAGSSGFLAHELGSSLQSRERAGIAFGTTVKLKAMHADAGRLETALDAAWLAIDGVEEAASLFRPNSALSRLNRDGVLDDPPAAFLAMLNEAKYVADITEGAFDVTVQPLWALYANAFAQGRSPSADELSELKHLVDYKAIDISPKRVRLTKPGMALTLNGIAQGYATGLCLKALADHGIQDALLDTGEIGVSGKRDGEEPWTAAISDPRDSARYIALARPLAGVLATSGDYATTFTSDFATNHIFDPQTLRSPVEVASVSVLAQSGGIADALATAMMVMGSQRSLQLAHSLQDVEILLITKDGRTMRTAGFPA